MRPKLTQKAIPFLGPIVDALYTSLPALSILNFLSISAVLYNEMRPYLLDHAPWIKIWMFFLLLIGIVVGVMVIVYLFVIPSLWKFRSQQMFTEQNEVLVQLTKVQDELKNIKGEINESRNNSTNKPPR